MINPHSLSSTKIASQTSLVLFLIVSKRTIGNPSVSPTCSTIISSPLNLHSKTSKNISFLLFTLRIFLSSLVNFGVKLTPNIDHSFISLFIY